MSESKKIILVLANKRLTSFRRAGITVGHEPVVMTMPPLSAEQLNALQDEPNIKVIVEEAEAQESTHKDQSTEAEAETDTQAKVFSAFDQLDPENAEHFTKGGKPELNALRALYGIELTAKERDEDWIAYLVKEQGGEA